MSGAGATSGTAGVAGTALWIQDTSTRLEVGDLFDLAGAAPFTVEIWATPQLDIPWNNVPMRWGDTFHELLDELAIYDHALAPERVDAHHRAAGR